VLIYIGNIYITYKHNKIADIYFLLLHELAHCKKDFNKAKGTNLISLDDEDDNEIAADNKAYSWMVDDKYYADIIKNIEYDVENENNYPKSFLLYRLAKDKRIEYSSEVYQKYNFVLKNSLVIF